MIDSLKELKGNDTYVKDIDAIYGNSDGYYYSVQTLERKNMICIVFSVNPNEKVLKSIESLRVQHPAIPLGGVYKEGYELNVELNLINIDSKASYENLFHQIIEMLKQHGLENVCSQTGSNLHVGLYRLGTKLKILSDEVFNDQKASGSNANSMRGIKSPILGYFVASIIFIGIIIVKNIIGSVFFLIPLAITAGGFRLAIEAFERVGGMMTRRHARNLIILFVLSMILTPIATLFFQMVVFGIPVLQSAIFAFKMPFVSLLAFAEMYKMVPINLAISLYATWHHIQSILNNSYNGKIVKRKNTKLL